MSNYFGADITDATNSSSLFDYSPFKNKYFNTTVPKYGSYFDSYGMPTEKGLGYKPTLDQQENYFESSVKAKGLKVPSETTRSPLKRILDTLSVGNYTIQGGLKNLTDNNPDTGFWSGAWEGLKAANPFGSGNPKGEASFKDVLTNLGWKTDRNPQGKWYNPLSWDGSNTAKNVLGFAGDVLLDPITYLTLGAEPLVAGSGRTLLKNSAKELAEQGFKDGMANFSKESLKSTLEKFGLDASEENVKSIMDKVVRTAGYQQPDTSIRFMGKTISDGKFLNPLRSLADNTVAPYYNQAKHWVGNMPLGRNKTLSTMFQSDWARHAPQMARENPEEFAKLIAFGDYTSDLTAKFKNAQNVFVDNTNNALVDLSPETRKSLTNLMEQKDLFNKVQKVTGSYTANVKTPEAQALFDQIFKAKKEVENTLNTFAQYKGAQAKVDSLKRYDDLLGSILNSPSYDYDKILNDANVNVFEDLPNMSRADKYDLINSFRNKPVSQIKKELETMGVQDPELEAYKIGGMVEKATKDMPDVERRIWMGQDPEVPSITRKLLVGKAFTDSDRNKLINEILRIHDVEGINSNLGAMDSKLADATRNSEITRLKKLDDTGLMQEYEDIAPKLGYDNMEDYRNATVTDKEQMAVNNNELKKQLNRQRASKKAQATMNNNKFTTGKYFTENKDRVDLSTGEVVNTTTAYEHGIPKIPFRPNRDELDYIDAVKQVRNASDNDLKQFVQDYLNKQGLGQSFNLNQNGIKPNEIREFAKFLMTRHGEEFLNLEKNGASDTWKSVDNYYKMLGKRFGYENPQQFFKTYKLRDNNDLVTKLANLMMGSDLATDGITKTTPEVKRRFAILAGDLQRLPKEELEHRINQLKFEESIARKGQDSTKVRNKYQEYKNLSYTLDKTKQQMSDIEEQLQGKIGAEPVGDMEAKYLQNRYNALMHNAQQLQEQINKYSGIDFTNYKKLDADQQLNDFFERANKAENDMAQRVEDKRFMESTGKNVNPDYADVHNAKDAKAERSNQDKINQLANQLAQVRENWLHVSKTVGGNFDSNATPLDHLSQKYGITDKTLPRQVKGSPWMEMGSYTQKKFVDYINKVAQDNGLNYTDVADKLLSATTPKKVQQIVEDNDTTKFFDNLLEAKRVREKGIDHPDFNKGGKTWGGHAQEEMQKELDLYNHVNGTKFAVKDVIDYANFKQFAEPIKNFKSSNYKFGKIEDAPKVEQVVKDVAIQSEHSHKYLDSITHQWLDHIGVRYNTPEYKQQYETIYKKLANYSNDQMDEVERLLVQADENFKPYMDSDKYINWDNPTMQDYFKGQLFEGKNPASNYGENATYNTYDVNGIKILSPVDKKPTAQVSMIKQGIERVAGFNKKLAKLMKQITFRAEDIDNPIFEAVTSTMRRRPAKFEQIGDIVPNSKGGYNIVDKNGNMIKSFGSEESASKYAADYYDFNREKMATEWDGVHQNDIIMSNNNELEPEQLRKKLVEKIIPHEIAHVLAKYTKNLIWDSRRTFINKDMKLTNEAIASRWRKAIGQDGSRIFKNANYKFEFVEDHYVSGANANLTEEDFAESMRKYIEDPTKFASQFPNRAKELKKAIDEFRPNEQFTNPFNGNDYGQYGKPTGASEQLNLTKEEYTKQMDDLYKQTSESGINEVNYKSFEDKFNKLNKLTDNYGANKNFYDMFGKQHPGKAAFETITKSISKVQRVLKPEVAEQIKKKYGVEGDKAVKAMEWMRNELVNMAQDERLSIPPELLDSYMVHAKGDAITKKLEASSKEYFGDWMPTENVFSKQRKFNQTIKEVNDFFKEKGFKENFFEDDALKLMMYRGLKSNQYVFDKRFANNLFDTLGTKIDDVNHIPVNQKIFASTKEVMDLIGKQGFHETQIEDVLKHMGLPDSKTLFLSEKPVIELTADTFARLKGLDSNFSAFALHDATAAYINKVGKLQMEDNKNTVLDLYDKFLKFWKVSNTIVNPSFHAGNYMSNQFQNFLAVGGEVANPKTQYEAAKILGNDEKFLSGSLITKDGKEIPWATVKEWMNRLRVVDAHRFQDATNEIGSKTVNTMSSETNKMMGKIRLNQDAKTPIGNLYNKVSDKLAPINPLNIDNEKGFIPTRYAYKAGELVENHSRAVNFIAQLKNGQDFRQAAESVDKYLFDYNDLSDFEKNVMKRVIPFYTWMRKNVPLQLEQIMRQPGTYATVGKGMRAIENAVPEQDKVPDQYRNRFAQDWVQLPFKVKGKSGKEEPLFLNPRLPISDLNKLNLTDILTSMSPALKTPLELGINQNLYFGTPINQGQGDTADAPGWLNGLLGGTSKQPAQITPEAKYLLSQLGGINNIGKIAEANGEGGVGNDRDLAAFAYLTGLKANTYDYEKFKNYTQKQHIAELKNLLVPKEERQQNTAMQQAILEKKRNLQRAKKIGTTN